MSNSNFTTTTVKELASLIKLELTETETAKFAKEMEETLDYIENLDSLNTTNTKPTFQTTGLQNRFQTEATNERNLKESEAFQNAPNSKPGYFQIKGLSYAK